MTNQTTRYLLNRRRKNLHPAWTQLAGNSRRTAATTPGGVHTVDPRSIEYHNRTIPVKGLRGATEEETACTGPNRCNSEDWSADSCLPVFGGIPHCYHVNAASCWPLIRVTIRHHYILCSWQRATTRWLSICVSIYCPLSLWLTNCVLTLTYVYITRVMIFLFFLFVSLVVVLYIHIIIMLGGGRCNGTRNLIIWCYSLSLYVEYL